MIKMNFLIQLNKMPFTINSNLLYLPSSNSGNICITVSIPARRTNVSSSLASSTSSGRIALFVASRLFYKKNEIQKVNKSFKKYLK